jgi:hypothetical protein
MNYQAVTEVLVFIGILILLSIGLITAPAATLTFLRWRSPSDSRWNRREVISFRILGGITLGFAVWLFYLTSTR